MACYIPLPATRKAGGGILIWSRLNPPKTFDLTIPCGQCIGCRLDRAKHWGTRIMHEAQLHRLNSFITLTYSDETLAQRAYSNEPEGDITPSAELAAYAQLSQAQKGLHSLRPRDVVLFMKRLRFDQQDKQLSKVKYYLVGEYGDKYGRPHYHIALFGEDFSGDRKIWRTSGSYTCYRSPRLEKLWPHGNSEIGELTIESAMYVGSYILKKINGKKADDHYKRTNARGENYWLEPEFAYISNGIGKEWLRKYHADVYPHDYVVRDGMQFKPPRYYDNLLGTWDPTTLAQIKATREERAKELADDNTPARLAVKETVTMARMATKKRNLE